jgi:hypothetical protein
MLYAATAARRLGALAPSVPGLRAFSASARAASVARMQLVGRLGGDPELITTAGGREVVRYTVATNYGPAEDRKVSWFRVASYLPEGPQRAFLLGIGKGCVSVFLFVAWGTDGRGRSQVLVEADARMVPVEGEKGTTTYLNLLHRTLSGDQCKNR